MRNVKMLFVLCVAAFAVASVLPAYAFYYDVDYKTGGPMRMAFRGDLSEGTNPYLGSDHMWLHKNVYDVTNTGSVDLQNVGWVRSFYWASLNESGTQTPYYAVPWDNAGSKWRFDGGWSEYDNPSSGPGYYEAQVYGIEGQGDLFPMSRLETDAPLSWDPAAFPSPYVGEVASVQETDSLPVIWIGDIAAGQTVHVVTLYEVEDHVINMWGTVRTGCFVSQTNPVPEPSGLAALAAGLVGAVTFRLRKR